MKLFTLLLLCLSMRSVTLAADYHFSNKGNDAADGLTPLTAWNSLQKANSIVYKPGDRLLFESGGVWTGKLTPQGSGLQDKPIRLEHYGEGALPIIKMGEQPGPIVSFKNQDFWEVSEIEIVGGTAKPNTPTGGIHFVATDAGRILRHIVIRGCVIRDLGGSFQEYTSCAIWVGVEGWNKEHGFKTTFEWVLIENNIIREGGRSGILVWTTSAPAGQQEKTKMFRDGLLPSKHVIIRKNVIEDLGGDAILVLGSVAPLIEYNTVRRTCLFTGDPLVPVHPGYNPHSAAVWLHSCLEGIMQFNEVTDSGKQPGNNDGMAFDFDFNCKRCLLQYNVSRDNAGGFLIIMHSAIDNIARYNLSIDDGDDHLLYLVGQLHENNIVHNNTFHVQKGNGYIIPRAKLYNNAFLISGTATMENRQEGPGEFCNNVYFGNWKKRPNDPAAIIADPKFKRCISGDGTPTFFLDYSLQSDSPCRARGISISNHGGRDLLGNAVPKDSAPDIGAFQYKP